MKKLLVACCFMTTLYAHNPDGDIVSHSFFSVRPHFQAGSPEKETIFRAFHRKTDCDTSWKMLMQAVVYGGASTEDCSLARFFMPFGRSTITIVEYKPGYAPSTTDTDKSKDIEARHFNIETDNNAQATFRSEISLKPKQKVFGVGFDFKNILYRCNDGTPRLWLECSFPIERVENNLHFEEYIYNTGGGVVDEIGLDGHKRVGSMQEALTQDMWKYGRIDDKCRHKVGVADIEVKLNGSAYHSTCCAFDWYLGLVIPTGTKINCKQARYVFSPVVGNNHHWGMLGGAYLNFDIWQHNEHKFFSAYDYVGGYLFQNHQIRSFDLKDHQWGRYMEVYRSLDAAEHATENSGTSGINVFTKPVTVKPRLYATFNSAFIYNFRHFMAEIGYNLYLKHAEEVALCNGAWNENVVLKGVNGLSNASLARTIRYNFINSESPIICPDPETVYSEYHVRKEDLNINSAAHPAVMSNTLYGNLGFQWDIHEHPFFMGIGGSYEFSSINTTLNRWTAWGKLGLSI